jgi:hypothetical protein
MAISTASGPWRSLTGFITPITYVFATDIVSGDYQIQDAGAEILVLSPADGGPASAVNFILPNVVTNDGNAWVGPQSAKPELNGIKGSITNYGAVAHVLKGTGTQPVSGNPAGVTVAAATIVQWGGNGNPNAPWIAISNAILAA